jgi:hypothetical protein
MHGEFEVELAFFHANWEAESRHYTHGDNSSWFEIINI